MQVWHVSVSVPPSFQFQLYDCAPHTHLHSPNLTLHHTIHHTLYHATVLFLVSALADHSPRLFYPFLHKPHMPDVLVRVTIVLCVCTRPPLDYNSHWTAFLSAGEEVSLGVIAPRNIGPHSAAAFIAQLQAMVTFPNTLHLSSVFRHPPCFHNFSLVALHYYKS